MSKFFASSRPGRTVSHGQAVFELPVLYFRDDFFCLFYTADPRKVKARMPSDRLHPVLLTSGKAMVGIAAFNYLETTIGPYGEVAVVIPAVYRSSPPPYLAPALMEARYPGFGLLVVHLPVTKTVARDAGRGEWGYTKFVANMRFTISPEFMESRLSGEVSHMLTLRVARKGFVMKDRKPLVTYSVRRNNLIRTRIPQRGLYRINIMPRGSNLVLGNHPVSDSIRGLGLAARPFLSRYYLERSAILPSGVVVERGVRTLEGYYGKECEGEHRVVYAQ